MDARYSRLYFKTIVVGHRIPAWYDNEGNIYVGRNEQAVREKYQLTNDIFKQDEDVLDNGLFRFMDSLVHSAGPKKHLN